MLFVSFGFDYANPFTRMNFVGRYPPITVLNFYLAATPLVWVIDENGGDIDENGDDIDEKFPCPFPCPFPFPFPFPFLSLFLILSLFLFLFLTVRP